MLLIMLFKSLLTHADGSRESNAISGICVCLGVFVCPHDKTKTSETKNHHQTWHRDSLPWYGLTENAGQEYDEQNYKS